MKHEVLFSAKRKSKKLKCRLQQYLFGALRVKFTGNKNVFPPFFQSEEAAFRSGSLPVCFFERWNLPKLDVSLHVLIKEKQMLLDE